jgi:hypothetical protein
MKNAIRILLYLLLALLVVAIAVIIYKRSKAPVDDVPTTAEMADSLFMDQNQSNQTALNGEDSMILDMTGQLPSQVGAPASTDSKTSENKPSESKSAEPVTKQATNTNSNNSSIDYSQPVTPSEQTAAVNTSPKAQKVADHPSKAKAEPVIMKKTESKSISSGKTAAKPSTNKPSATKSAGFYVVSGSFIVPGHADEQVKKLKKMGYKSANKKVFGSSEYYSAVVGYYDSRSEAQKVASKLQAKGEKAFLKAK